MTLPREAYRLDEVTGRLPHLSIRDSESGPSCKWPRQNAPVTLPLSGQWPVIVAAWPMSDAEWDQMVRLLEVMRPGLTGKGAA